MHVSMPYSLPHRAEHSVPIWAVLAGDCRCRPQTLLIALQDQQGPFKLESPKAHLHSTDSVQPGSHGRLWLTSSRGGGQHSICGAALLELSARLSAETHLALPASCTPGPAITCAISHLVDFFSKHGSGRPRKRGSWVLDSHVIWKYYTVLMPG